MFRRFSDLLTLVVVGLFVAAPAFADVETPVSIEVSYDESALATAQGASDLLAQIEADARDACRFTQPVTGAPRIDDTCVDALIQQAVTEIGSDALAREAGLDVKLASLN